jgi:hypothetical protein
MSDAPDRPLRAELERLCAVLEQTADALAAVDAVTLLETESALAVLTQSLAGTRAVGDATGLAALVERARFALRRCRRLGESFATVAGARLGLRVGPDGYGRDGAYARPDTGPSSIHAVT